MAKGQQRSNREPNKPKMVKALEKKVGYAFRFANHGGGYAQRPPPEDKEVTFARELFCAGPTEQKYIAQKATWPSDTGRGVPRQTQALRLICESKSGAHQGMSHE